MCDIKIQLINSSNSKFPKIKFNVENEQFEIKNKIIDGVCKEYYRNRDLLMKCNHKNGKRDGKYELYHENGGLHVLFLYKNGLTDKQYEEYDKNGKQIRYIKK